MSPGEVLVFVLISVPQEGQIVCVACGPNGMTVVTMCCAVKIGCCGVKGCAALTPFTAVNCEVLINLERESIKTTHLVHSWVALKVGAQIRKVVDHSCSFYYLLIYSTDPLTRLTCARVETEMKLISSPAKWQNCDSFPNRYNDVK